MKIALVNPPYLVIYEKINIRQDASIPLGLLYIAAMLEKAGHEVKVFDPNLHNTPLPQLIDEIKLFSPKLIGLTTVTPTFNSAQKIADELKKNSPESTIVMGGPHVSVLPEESLKLTPAVDFIVIGEGELTIVDLAAAVEKKAANFSEIKGICCRNNGQITLNPERPGIEDLDTIPYPAYHLLPIKEYSQSIVYKVKMISASVMSSRGCPASCTFCANQVTGRKLRVHSIDYFLGLIYKIASAYGIRHFHILDDNFMADQNRVMEICRRIIKEKLGITWFIFARTDHCQNVDLLRMMKKAGCVYIQFGIESGNDEVLRQLGKKISKEIMYNACMNCKKSGIDYFNSFMIGNPKDTKETVYETVDYAIKLDSIMAGFNIFIPYPGTAVFKKYYQEDFKNNNNWDRWNHITSEIPIDYCHTVLSKRELDNLRKYAISRYYLRVRQGIRMLIFFKSFSLFFLFIKNSWRHLFFLFARQPSVR